MIVFKQVSAPIFGCDNVVVRHKFLITNKITYRTTKKWHTSALRFCDTFIYYNTKIHGDLYTT